MSPIVFDMYGTLLDETTVFHKFYKYIENKYSLDLNKDEFLNLFFKHQRKYIFANVKKSYKEITFLSLKKLVKEAKKMDVEMLFDLFKEMDFFPGVSDLLKELSKKYTLAILTNTDNDLLTRINLAKKSPVTFAKIFTAQENGVYKPNKAAYQTLVNYFKPPPQKIIYVSATEWDIKAARLFGFNVKTMSEMRDL